MHFAESWPNVWVISGHKSPSPSFKLRKLFEKYRDSSLSFEIPIFEKSRVRYKSLGLHVIRATFVSFRNVCLQSDVPRKRGKYWEGISASDRISLKKGGGGGGGKGGGGGGNQSRIFRRTRCKFPCCNLVLHLIRCTTFCLYCASTGGKDCESYLSVVTLSSLNGRYVRG